MTEAAQQQLDPVNFEFTGASYAKMTAAPLLKEGWFKVKVQGPAKNAQTEGDKGTYFQELNLKVLDGNDNPTRTMLKHRLYMPFTNRLGEQPNTIGFFESYLRAVKPSVFKVSQKGWTAAQKAAFGETVMQELRARWEDPQTYADEQMYVKVVHEPDFKDPSILRARVKVLIGEEPREGFYTEDFYATDD